VWELNYRGELQFLRQALAQRQQRDLRLHDGWRYFLHGWLTIIEEVFGVTIDGRKFDALAAISEPGRPSLR
jgi:hypothetical protein